MKSLEDVNSSCLSSQMLMKQTQPLRSEHGLADASFRHHRGEDGHVQAANARKSDARKPANARKSDARTLPEPDSDEDFVARISTGIVCYPQEDEDLLEKEQIPESDGCSHGHSDDEDGYSHGGSDDARVPDWLPASPNLGKFALLLDIFFSVKEKMTRERPAGITMSELVHEVKDKGYCF